MGPYFTFAQVGSRIVSQVRYALSRHSSSHSGSSFFAEMRRTISSLRPRGSDSCSTSVTKPYRYSRLASSSIVCVDVLMVLSLCTERNAAPAGALGVRVIQHEALAQQARVVVEHRSIEQPQAPWIDKDPGAVRPLDDQIARSG